MHLSQPSNAPSNCLPTRRSGSFFSDRAWPRITAGKHRRSTTCTSIAVCSHDANEFLLPCSRYRVRVGLPFTETPTLHLRSSLNRFLSLVVIVAVATIMLNGCNDEPTPVGSEYLPETVNFKTYVVAPEEYDIVSGQALLSNSTSRGATTMLVGRADDGTIAHGLVAITDP